MYFLHGIVLNELSTGTTLSFYPTSYMYYCDIMARNQKKSSAAT
jgi:hypothetical protein